VEVNKMANTIKIIIFSLTVLFFSNCKNRTNKEIIKKGYSSFVYIDMSYYDGWTNYYSLKLFNDGKMYVYNNQHRKGDLYYECTINNNELDSISKTVSILLGSSIDSLYKRSCEDCVRYNLIIKATDRKFKSLVQGVDYNNNNIIIMNDLATFLYSILKSSKASIDTVFNFESRTPNFLPPPLPVRLR
jgi:hypothetical protein